MAPTLHPGPPRLGLPAGPPQLLREGHHVSRKGVQRLWREEGLRVPARSASVSALSLDHAGRSPGSHSLGLRLGPLLAVRRHCATGRTIGILPVTDEYTREPLADVVGYSIDADATAATLDKMVGHRGPHPKSVRMDNGTD